jgi:hypothetical protein
LYLAPFDELADPRVLIELAMQAESSGWDGLFLWDHIVWRAPVRAVADPWVALSAIAARTERLRLGPLVTPLSRRRVQKLARETVTLDHLSAGRLTLGVGLGADIPEELVPFGEVVEPRERARLLDHGLSRLAELWAGELTHRRSSGRESLSGWRASGRTAGLLHALQRGMGCSRSSYLDRMPSPSSPRRSRNNARPTKVRLTWLSRSIPERRSLHGAKAGATWVLTGFGPQPREAEVRHVIANGPR